MILTQGLQSRELWPLSPGSGFIALALAGQEEEHLVRMAEQRNPAHSTGIPEGVKAGPRSVS